MLPVQAPLSPRSNFSDSGEGGDSEEGEKNKNSKKEPEAVALKGGEKKKGPVAKRGYLMMKTEVLKKYKRKYCVLRGDNDWLTIGARSNIQDGSVLHTDEGIELVIGTGVTIGHKVILHGCTISDSDGPGINGSSGGQLTVRNTHIAGCNGFPIQSVTNEGPPPELRQ